MDCRKTREFKKRKKKNELHDGSCNNHCQFWCTRIFTIDRSEFEIIDLEISRLYFPRVIRKRRKEKKEKKMPFYCSRIEMSKNREDDVFVLKQYKCVTFTYEIRFLLETNVLILLCCVELKLHSRISSAWNT